MSQIELGLCLTCTWSDHIKWRRMKPAINH